MTCRTLELSPVHTLVGSQAVYLPLEQKRAHGPIIAKLLVPHWDCMRAAQLEDHRFVRQKHGRQRERGTVWLLTTPPPTNPLLLATKYL